mgnify:CR=1 FL=1
MKQGHLFAGIACMIVLILLVQCATAGFIERSVVPAGNSTYRVILKIPEGTVAGITETLPTEMVGCEVSLPPGQYKIDGNTVTLVIIDEREASYLVTMEPGASGVITGSVLDFLTGEKSTLPGAQIASTGAVGTIPAEGAAQIPNEDTGKHPVPLDTVIIVGAIGLMGVGYSMRRRDP